MNQLFQQVTQELPTELQYKIKEYCFIECISCFRHTNDWNICQDCNRSVCKECYASVKNIYGNLAKPFIKPICVLCSRTRVIISRRSEPVFVHTGSVNT